MKHFCTVAAAAVLGLAAAGCGPRPAGEPVTVAALAARLADPLELARLDRPDTRLHSTYDRTGGNNDYSAFVRDSRTPGWKVVADLKGPGYVSRLWFTGGKGESIPQPFRFYFDGEETPRFEGDFRTLFNGRTAPFLAPLADWNNFCWYSFVPLPYAKSLRIECEGGGPNDKIYYQVSESALPRGTPVETFTWPLPERDTAALEKLRTVWAAGRLPAAGEKQEFTLADWPQGVSLAGPAVIRRLEFEPDWAQIPEEARDAALRDWMVAIRFDGGTNDSVRVPLGDLCGMPWRRVRAHSLYFGMEGDTLFCAFPMPFAKAAEIRLESGRVAPVPVQVRAWVEKRAEPQAPLGYFHAGWWRTTPADAGRPHPILRVKGNGKYVGCLLSVVTLDGSYWALEGDESIRKDGEKTPGWLGTGLEDYFNGGWYYQNVMAGPTHGLFVKEPFRTVQYRVHAMDPTRFAESLDMYFERGPDRNASRAYFESVSWCYLDRPQTADTVRLRPSDRSPPPDPRLDPAGVMAALWSHERFGDWQGARDELAGRLKRYGAQLPPGARRMLEFRLALLEEKLGGPDPLPRFREDPDEAVAAAAKMLAHVRETGAALAVFYANMPAKLFLDGREILQAGNPERPTAAALSLAPGRHVLAIQTVRQRYPDWVQLALRGKDWFVGTDGTWKFTFDPAGDWAAPGYDDSAWPELGGAGVKGPPEEPYIWVEPDPFLDMESRARGIRPVPDWQPQANTVVYRREFQAP